MAIVDAARPIFDAPGSRVSRAAILAAGAAIMAGCSSSDPTPTTMSDSGTTTETDGSMVVQPAYGAPIGTGDDGGGVAQPVYGAPISPIDAGSDDASSPGEGGVAQPVYGAPAPDAGN